MVKIFFAKPFMGGVILKRLFIIMLSLCFLMAACSHQENNNNKMQADDILVFYGVSSYAMFGAKQEVINDLLNQFSTLSFKKTEDKMDVASAFNLIFSYKGKEVKRFWVDKNGVFWLDGNTECYKISSGSFDYLNLKTIYEDSKQTNL